MFFEIRVKRGLIVNIIPLYIVPIYIYLYIFTCVFCTCILHMIDKWFLSQSVGFKLGQCFLSDGKSLVASNQRWINYDQKHKGGATCTPYLKHKNQHRSFRVPSLRALAHLIYTVTVPIHASLGDPCDCLSHKFVPVVLHVQVIII